MPVSLVATRFSSCRGSASWKTRTHMGKPAPTALVATRFSSCRGSASWKTCTHMGKLAATSLCGDKISIVSGMCKLENLHTHGKTCSHVSLWRQDFHRVGHVQVGKLAPTWENLQPRLFVATRFPSCRGSASWKTRTHMENLHPRLFVATRFSSCRGSASWKTCTHMGKPAPTSLVATRFPSCRGSASWKTCTHMGKLAATSLCGDKISILSGMCKLENLHPHGKLAPTKGLERSSFRTHPSWTCSSHCGRPVYGSTFERWHQSGHGFRKLIKLLENAIAMAVETAKAELAARGKSHPWTFSTCKTSVLSECCALATASCGRKGCLSTACERRAVVTVLTPC